MVSIKYLFTIFHRFGMISLHHYKSERLNKLHERYVKLCNCLVGCFLLSQTYSIITRATQYTPELIWTCILNFTLWFLWYVALFTQANYKQILYFFDLVDLFSKADKQVIQKSYREAKQIYIGMFVTISFVYVAILIQSVTPIPHNELDIRRNIYKTKHPERHLPYDIRIPFIDESESWAYRILFVYQLYILTYFSVCTPSVMSFLPVVMIHLRGQYEILCKYINLIGQEHRDACGNAIYYTNIEEDQYEILKKEAPFPKRLIITREQLIQMEMKKIRRQKKYEAHYLRQIIRFHQRLLFCQLEVNITYETFLILK
uniref:Odorant receptor n=1 Tax=Cacopsylla melanoneura TaxID=428564 RepID=A0A8D8VLN4_9HEMI